MIRWTARHPLVPAALVGIVLCLGGAAVWRMPIDYLFGTPPAPLLVWLEAPSEPGREAVLGRLVRPLEERLSAEPGLARVRSRVFSAAAFVEVELRPGEDVQERAARLREIAAAVARSGPVDASSTVWRAPPQQERPGLLVQLAGVDRQAVEEELLPRLRQIQGLRAVELFPPSSRRIGLQVTAAEPGAGDVVRAAVRRASDRRLLGRAGMQAVVSPAAPSDLVELLNVPVAGSTVGELVRPGTRLGESSYQYRVNGREGLFLIVHDDTELPRRSALGVARRLVEAWAAARPGTSVTVVWDRWHEVLSALGGLAVAALVGMVLAVAALGLTLRRARVTVLMASSVPLSVVLALVLLAVAGRGLDVVALGALAVALGLLVDAAVVVGESLALQRDPDPATRAAAGVRDAVRPLALGGVTTVLALSPVWLDLVRDADLLSGALLPLVCALVASIVVACTVVPGLATAIGEMPRMRRLPVVSRRLKGAIRDPVVAAGSVLALAIVVLLVVRLPGGDLVREGDPHNVELELSQPTGADPEAFADTLQELELRVARVEGVEHVFALVRDERAWLWLRLEQGWGVGGRRRNALVEVADALGGNLYYTPFRWQLTDASRRTLSAEAVDLTAMVNQLGVRVAGDDLRLVGIALSRVWAVAQQKRQLRLPTRKRVVLEPRLPGLDLAAALNVAPDRHRPVQLVWQGNPVQVEVLVSGEPVVDSPPPLRSWLESANPSGLTPMRVARHRVAEVHVWPGREDGVFVRRADLQVTHRRTTLEDKRKLRADLHDRLRRLPVPAGVTVTADQLEVVQPAPAWVVPTAVAAVCLFIALGVGFESLVAPLRVVAVLLPHLAGAVLVLWLARLRVNEAVVFGTLLLLGVAVNSGVLLEDRFLRLRRRGVRRHSAAARAGIERAPAVLLTAATSVLALAPLWFGGVNQLGRPFVAVLGGGLLLGTPATLVLLPALQALGARRRKRQPIAWRGDGSDVVLLRSLSRAYGTVRALRGVSASLGTGMAGLLGPNGAGKTTLIRIVVGALAADTGDVWVNGVRRRDDPEGWRHLVGYLPQAQVVPTTLEAGAWLGLWAAELELPEPERAVAEALAALGVADLSDRRLGELSGGQQRRVRVARALLGRPPILVVDEPTTGLDPEARVDLRNLLSHLSRERVVLLSTHIPEDIAVACRRVLVLADGELRLDGTVDDLLARAHGKVRQRLVADTELREVVRTHRVVSRIRELEGIRIRYLCDDPTDPGDPVDPTVEEAYLWLVGADQTIRRPSLE